MTLQQQIHYLKLQIDMVSDPYHEHHSSLYALKAQLAKLEETV